MSIKSKLAATAATAAVILGGSVITAPPAAAAVPSACNWEWQWPQKKRTTAAVNLRSGPSTNYVSKGILFTGTTFTEYCNKDFEWSYGKVTSGANSGKWGWVAGAYLR